MAARKEILSDLSSKIADGNIRDAYRTFEDLPVVDQIAVSISPGVGDALAAYEVGEFGARAKTNIEDKDYLGATGNYAMAGLSLASLYPLFRFLRGAKGVTKSATKKADALTETPLIKQEPLQLAPPRDLPQVELPKIQPFEPKGINEISYNTLQPSIDLNSKARKWVNGYHPKSLGKKVQELPPQEWVNKLIDAGIPTGELRLLNIIDESKDIHPKFLNETAGTDKISRGFLDDYMARQQRDAIQIRGVPEAKLEAPDTRFANRDLQKTQNQAVYHVRGSGEYRGKPDHFSTLKYPDGTTGDTAYVFDGIGTNKPLSRAIEQKRFDQELNQESLDEVIEKLNDINLKPDDKITSIFRVQSDFQGEVADTYRPKMIRDFAATIKTIENTDSLPFININNAARSYSQNITDQLKGMNSQSRMLSQNLNPAFVKAIANADTDALKKILGDDLYKVFTDDTLAERIPGKFFAPNFAFDVGDTGRAVSFTEFVDGFLSRSPKMTQKKAIDTMFNKLGVDKDIADLGTKAETIAVVETIFKQRRSIDAINKKIIGKSANSRGGFIDPAQQKIILKKLKDYNKQVDEINTQIASGANVDVDRIIGQLNRSVTDFDIDKMSISPRDIEKITGKPFSQSLDKTPEEIFNMPAGPLGGPQKYFSAGPRVEDRVKAYFDDIADEGKTFFELANGVKVLKKAVGINAKEFGMKIDPYFEGGSSKYIKLPVRSRVLAAVKSGQDGVHIGNKQAITEQSPNRVIEQYASGENELQKILDELIPSSKQQKGMISKIEGTDTEFDGTYLKFTDEFRKAVEEKGIDAFKLGGAVEIDRMLAKL
tara:strand:+ start:1047 stop:3527 length:2481 start_codon:yes stop_codon:yes gene_type:complete